MEVNHPYTIWIEFSYLKNPTENKPWAGLYNQVLNASRVSIFFQWACFGEGGPLGFILDESSEGILRFKIIWLYIWKRFWVRKNQDAGESSVTRHMSR